MSTNFIFARSRHRLPFRPRVHTENAGVQELLCASARHGTCAVSALEEHGAIVLISENAGETFQRHLNGEVDTCEEVDDDMIYAEVDKRLEKHGVGTFRGKVRVFACCEVIGRVAVLQRMKMERYLFADAPADAVNMSLDENGKMQVYMLLYSVRQRRRGGEETYSTQAKHEPLKANDNGETFSHVFNTTSTSLEYLLLDRQLKGPGWLRINKPSKKRFL